MGCGSLTSQLRKKCCIYSIDTFDDNLCGQRCLAIYKRKYIQGVTEFVTRAALDLASEYYDDDKLKRKDLRPTKLVGFEGIARHHNVNIMLYEKRTTGKGCSIYMLVSLWQGPVRKQHPHNKREIIRGSLFLYQKDGHALQAMGM